MSKTNNIPLAGKVLEVLPDLKYRVEIQFGNETKTILGYLCGKMKMHKIKVLEGDGVTIEVSPYDLSKGRIIKREFTKKK